MQRKKIEINYKQLKMGICLSIVINNNYKI